MGIVATARLALVLPLVFCLVAGSPSAGLEPAAAEDPLVGLWATEPDEYGYARVRVSREADGYRGEIVWLSEPLFPASEGPEWADKPKVDRLNPDPELRDRPIIGLPLLWGFERKGENRWTGGYIYDPASGKTYKCRITLDEDGTLQVRGYVGVALLGRTTTWKPVSNDEAAGGT